MSDFNPPPPPEMMRADVEPRALLLLPRQPVRFVVDVANTSGVIDGYTASVLGVDPAWVVCTPESLQLFPGQRGQIFIDLTVSATFPAGTTPLAVKVSSLVDPARFALMEVQATVASVANNEIRLTPKVVTTAKRGRFDVLITNDSNIDHVFDLEAHDVEGRLNARVRPARVAVRAGGMATARLSAVGGRPILGAPSNRQVTVTATSGGQTIQDDGTLIQKPVVPRGLLPFVVVLCLLGLWVALLTPVMNHLANRKGANANLTNAAFNANDAAAQAGTGPVANGIGGTVTISPSGLPLSGATLAAFLADNPTAPAATAATGPDGAYRISGLQPGSYHVELTASGFPNRWYPSVTSFKAGSAVSVVGGKTTPGINLAVTGLPGSIAGAVSVPAAAASGGAAPSSAPAAATDSSGVTVVLRPVVPGTSAAGAAPASLTGPGVGGIALLDDSAPTAPQTRITDPSGAYNFDNLPTPGTYQLSFDRQGYGEQVTDITLGPGATQTAPPITLTTTAVGGSIAGTVTDGTNPLGGVNVTATNGNVTFHTVTLTTGAVGTYILKGLPSPASFTITFSLAGFNPATVADNLGAGQAATGINATLSKGTSVVKGLVSGPSGPLPGATVTVTDGTTTISTATANDPAGSFEVDGVPAGVLTVTAAFTGFANQVRQVTATPSAPTTVDFTMVEGVGAFIGSVMAAPEAGQPYVIPGQVGVTATSPAAPAGFGALAGGDGSFALTNLPPGAYTIKITSAGYTEVDLHVTIAPNANLTQQVSLVPIRGSMRGFVLGPTVQPTPVPLQGVAVSLTPQGTAGGAVQTTATKADGSWEIDNLPSGLTYTVGYALSGYVPGSQIEALTPGEHLQLPGYTLQAAPGGINGQIVGPNGPVAGVSIKLTDTSGAAVKDVNGAPVASIVSSATAPFRFDNLVTPGTYQLTFTSNSFGAAPIQVTLGPGETRALGPVTVAPIAQKVSGVLLGPVTSSTAEPLPNVTVTLTGGAAPLSAVTDNTGVFVFPSVPSGTETYTLNVNPPGYVAQQIPFQVIAGQDVNRGQIVLQAAPGSISGLVANPQGPLAKANITVEDSSLNQVGSATQLGATPFTVSNLATPGVYVVMIADANGSNQSTSQTVTLAPGQNLNLGTINLTPVAGGLTGTVSDPELNPLPGATVSAQPNSGGGSPASTVTSSSGSYTLPGLLPGAYTLTVTPSATYSPVQLTVTVNAGPQLTTENVQAAGIPVTVSGSYCQPGVLLDLDLSSNGHPGTTVEQVFTSGPSGGNDSFSFGHVISPGNYFIVVHSTQQGTAQFSVAAGVNYTLPSTNPVPC